MGFFERRGLKTMERMMRLWWFRLLHGCPCLIRAPKGTMSMSDRRIYLFWPLKGYSSLKDCRVCKGKGFI